MTNQELTLEEIHKGTLVIFKKIIEICDVLNIDYYLAYGTLLGAVRHQGFIPWDDDFDIMMLRNDYDKFVDYCNQHENELKPYRIMNYFNTEGYPFAISRFCDLSYRMEMNDGNDYGMGMFIDVYPLDGRGVKTSEFVNKYLDIKRKVLGLGLYYSYEHCVVPETGSFLKRCGRKVFCIYARKMKTKYFIDQFEKMARHYSVEESRYVSCVIWETTRPLKKEWYDEITYLNFEGIRVKAPKGYHRILKQSYGDYMQLPPKDKRVPHHEYKLYKK